MPEMHEHLPMIRGLVRDLLKQQNDWNIERVEFEDDNDEGERLDDVQEEEEQYEIIGGEIVERKIEKNDSDDDSD